MAEVNLIPVNEENWRDVALLEVSEEQFDFVASGSYYLCLCHYDGEWNPLAIEAEENVVGFLMWAVDDADGSCWLGGITISKEEQGKGYGKAAVRKALAMLKEKGYSSFALSYDPLNTRAAKLYADLGFVDQGVMEEDEKVVRLKIKD